MLLHDILLKNCPMGRANRAKSPKPKWLLFLEYGAFFFIASLLSVHLLPNIFGKSSNKTGGGWFAWDGEYFMQVKDKGYRYEKNHAFMPLMPMLMRALPQHWLAYLLSRTCLNLLNLYLLMQLASSFIGSSRYDYFILKSYIIQPGLVYLLCGYSESLYLTFTLVGLVLLERSKTSLTLITSSMWFSLATLTRANGVLNLIFILYALIQRVFARDKPVSCCSLWRNIILGLICYFIVTIPLFYVTSTLPYEMYCLGRLKRGETDLNPWCYEHLPNLYSWVQSQYWYYFLISRDVGLFENFLHRPLLDKGTSLPMYFFTIYILIHYFQLCAAHFFSCGILIRQLPIWKRWESFIFEQEKLYLSLKEPESRKIKSLQDDPFNLGDYGEATSLHLYGSLKLLPYVVQFSLNMMISLMIGNFEINNRLASGCPMFYLALAQCELQFQHNSYPSSLVPLVMKVSFLLVCVANLNLVPTSLAFL